MYKNVLPLVALTLLSTLPSSGQTPLPLVEIGRTSEIRYGPFVYLNVKDEAVKDQIRRAIFVDKNGLLATVNESKAANFIIGFLSKPVKENETGQIKADWISPNPKGQM